MTKDKKQLKPSALKLNVPKYPESVRLNAIALRNTGMSYAQISKALPNNPSQGIIHKWCNDHKYKDEVTHNQRLEAFKKGLAGAMLDNACVIMDAAMQDEKLNKMSTLQGITATGILTQRSQELLNGVSSGVNIQVNIGRSERASNDIQKYEAEILDIDAQIAELGG